MGRLRLAIKIWSLVIVTKYLLIEKLTIEVLSLWQLSCSLSCLTTSCFTGDKCLSVTSSVGEVPCMSSSSNPGAILPSCFRWCTSGVLHRWDAASISTDPGGVRLKLLPPLDDVYLGGALKLSNIGRRRQWGTEAPSLFSIPQQSSSIYSTSVSSILLFCWYNKLYMTLYLFPQRLYNQSYIYNSTGHENDCGVHFRHRTQRRLLQRFNGYTQCPGTSRHIYLLIGGLKFTVYNNQLTVYACQRIIWQSKHSWIYGLLFCLHVSTAVVNITPT